MSYKVIRPFKDLADPENMTMLLAISFLVKDMSPQIASPMAF